MPQPKSNPGSKFTPMTQDRASAIQSANAKKGADTGKGSFPAKAQSAAAKNENAVAAAAPHIGGARVGGKGDK